MGTPGRYLRNDGNGRVVTSAFYFIGLNRVAKLIEEILMYHKISFDTLITLVTRKYMFSKQKQNRGLHDQTAVDYL